MPRLRPAPENKEDPKITAASSAATEPEIEVEVAPEVEVEIEEPEVKQDDATLALKKQIEDLRKSEQILRERNDQFAREREEALERARQREAQIVKVQKEAYDSQSDAISSALAAAQAEADKAQLDIENAISLGDAKSQAEAQRRLAMAASNLTRLQEGKEAAEARAKEPPSTAGVDVIDTWGYPPITTDWLKNHRHLLTDPKSLNRLRYFQDQVTDEGLTPHTKGFLERVEVLLGERAAPEVEEVVTEKPAKKGPIVSAPVSRDVPNANGQRKPGKVTLSPQEVEAARISGVSVEEYAKQKIRKAELIASGEYGEQR